LRFDLLVQLIDSEAYSNGIFDIVLGCTFAKT